MFVFSSSVVPTAVPSAAADQGVTIGTALQGSERAALENLLTLPAEPVAGDHHAFPLGRVKRPVNPSPQPQRASQFVQASTPMVKMADPVTSFEGVSALDQPGAGLPPDSDGAVGPNHFVQWINTSLAIYSKTGTRIFGPVPGNSLWRNAGFTNPCGTQNDGDPIVLYDRAADRWLLTQFAFLVVSPSQRLAIPLAATGCTAFT
jgi:hypothetical protein